VLNMDNNITSTSTREVYQLSNMADNFQLQDQHICQSPQSLDDWQKLPEFLNNYSQFTEQQMRWLLLHRQTNGLDVHVRKIGKPIYIHVPGFLKWIFERKER